MHEVHMMHEVHIMHQALEVNNSQPRSVVSVPVVSSFCSPLTRVMGFHFHPHCL